MNEDIICNRCGRCCHYLVKGVLTKCRYLIVVGNKTICRIYKNRLGTIIYRDSDITVKCDHRDNIKRDYDGCPYNKGGQ